MAGTDEETRETPSKPKKTETPPAGNYFRILGYGTTLDHVLMGAAAICACGAGITLPLMNIIFGNLVSDFNGFFIPGSGIGKETFQASVSQNALYLVYLFIAKLVLGYISMFSLRMTGIRISARLRLSYLRALFGQPISVFDTLPPGRPTTAITSSSNLIQAGISDKLAVLVQAIAMVIGAYAVAFRYSWSLTLVCSASFVFMLLVYGIVFPNYMRIYKQQEKSDENASSIATEALGTIRTIVACGAEERLSQRYKKCISESQKKGLRLSPLIGIQLSPTNFAQYCNFALAFWFGVRQYVKGHVSDAGPVVIVVFSLLLVVMAISNIAAPLMAISKAITASTTFFDMLDAPPAKQSGLKDPDVSASEDIMLKDVVFSYPSRPGVTVLDKLTLNIPRGKLTAIVGQSGCGKSTIVGLLERWYQIGNKLEGLPSVVNQKRQETQDDTEKKQDSEAGVENSGCITIGSHNIEDVDLKWWRSQIGLVQQEPFSFNASIYTNVAYGLVGSKWENESEERKRELVKEACQEAYATEFIDRLPEGYDTMIGENGIKLSGGQRQRLAIARSIIKRPPILILDEATSSIDVRGERIVQKALDQVSKTRTTITIAHRLSTIKKADNIIVLKKGKAVEQGTHEELLLKKGLYYDLVSNQSLEMGGEDHTDEELDETPKPGFDTQDQHSPKGEMAIQMPETDVGLVPDPEDTHKPKSFVRSVGLFLWEQSRWFLYICIVVGAAGCGACYAIQSFLFAHVIQTFQFTGDKLISQSEFWALMFFILAIGAAICYFALGWASTSLSMYIAYTYRQQYFDSILAKPISFYDQEGNSAGSLSARLSTDPTQLQELFGLTMVLPLISVFNVMGCIAISFAFGWKLTLVAMFSAFPIIIGAMFVRVRYEVQFDKMNAEVFADSSQFASEAIGAFRTVTSLTLEDTITGRYEDLLKNHVRKAFLKARFAALVFALSDSLDLPCMALCFWYGGQLLSTHEYNVIQFFVIYTAVVMGGQAAGYFGSVTPNLAQATAAANRILSLRVHRGLGDASATPVSSFENGAQIRFDSIGFKYPTRDVSVFNNLSFTIEKGQFAALVGPSGCGKSTIIGLLERFYDYQSGSVTVDGIELRSLDVTEYRKSLSLVSQEPALYQGSVRDNVILGVEPHSVTDDQVVQACKDAEIHDFIISLPDGYDTDVGLRGLTLSGGQKQRICIARALIRNPSILLLDEATSSLDSESEKLVQASIERSAKGRTVVVVAHRLATIQNADIIFVFGEGGIIEQGSHQALLKKRGFYYQMCESQALDR